MDMRVYSKREIDFLHFTSGSQCSG